MKYVQHIHYHVPVKVCDRCGYASPSPHYNPIGLYEHIIHTIEDSNQLMAKILAGKKKK